jgi:hypothetical protein
LTYRAKTHRSPFTSKQQPKRLLSQTCRRSPPHDPTF